MQNDIINELVRDLKPVKPLASAFRRELVLWGISLIVVTLGIIYWFYKKDEFHAPEGRSLLELILLILAAKISGSLAVRSTSPHFAASRLNWWSWSLFLIWTLLLLVTFANIYYSNAPDALTALKYQTWLCPKLTLSIAIPLGVMLFLYLRKGYVLYPNITGIYLAQTALAFGVIGLSYICPWADPLHELLWHVLPVLVGSVFFGFTLSYMFAAEKYFRR